MRQARRFALSGLLLIGLLTVGSAPAFSQKAETIEATAEGTGTQMGQVVNIRLTINDYSTLEERQILVQAFTKGQNQGLVNALTRMRAVGHISLTGTIGYDVSYIRLIPTPTGRKIRFVTNRQISFAEAWTDSQSQVVQPDWRRNRFERPGQKQKHRRFVSGRSTSDR